MKRAWEFDVIKASKRRGGGGNSGKQLRVFNLAKLARPQGLAWDLSFGVPLKVSQMSCQDQGKSQTTVGHPFQVQACFPLNPRAQLGP